VTATYNSDAQIFEISCDVSNFKQIIQLIVIVKKFTYCWELAYR